MAGILRAREMVEHGLTSGKVLALGKIGNDIEYLILDFKDLGWETVYDYGSDLRFDKELKVGDTVELKLLDDYTAKWEKAKNDE